MKYCKLIPKSNLQATLYCHVDETSKEYGVAYSWEGYVRHVKMSNYIVEDATNNKVIAELLHWKGYH